MSINFKIFISNPHIWIVILQNMTAELSFVNYSTKMSQIIEKSGI